MELGKNIVGKPAMQTKLLLFSNTQFQILLSEQKVYFVKIDLMIGDFDLCYWHVSGYTDFICNN